MIVPQTYVPLPGPVVALRIPFSPDDPEDRSDLRDARWLEYTEEVYAIADWCGGIAFDSVDYRDACYLYIELLTVGGYITVSDGNWVLREVSGQFHTMTNQEFASEYTRLEM